MRGRGFQGAGGEEVQGEEEAGQGGRQAKEGTRRHVQEQREGDKVHKTRNLT